MIQSFCKSFCTSFCTSYIGTLKLPCSLLVCVVLTALISGTGQGASFQAVSPDGKLAIQLTDAPLSYSVTYNGAAILDKSPLGVVVAGWTEPRVWTADSESVKTVSFNRSWKPVHGYKSEYPDAGTEISVPLKSNCGERMAILIRASNEAVAFRYVLPESFATVDGQTLNQKIQTEPSDKSAEYVLEKELTGFAFGQDYNCFYTPNPQEFYDIRPLSQCRAMPSAVVVELKKGELYAAIAEAGSLERYVPLVIKPDGKTPGLLLAGFRKGTVKVSGALETPWRVVFAACDPGRFVENAYYLQNLNAPCAITDTSWIQVGKGIRNTSCQRPQSDRIADFNAANNYQFVHWDTGWNGQEYDKIPDHPTKIDGGRDLVGAIRYAHEKGQKFILYCNHKELENYPLDKTFQTYRDWGVDGVKFGFVNWESQSDLAWLERAIQKAAQYRLMVNVHDNYRPTGWERTYPNLVSVEGIAGNECSNGPSSTPQSRILMAYCRQITGMGDFTPCFQAARVKSRAFQLACGVIFFNPLQYLHWYDAPLDPNQTRFPELEYWSKMPTTWDDSRVLDGVPGEYIVVARRKGDQWFVSAITDTARELPISLKFLSDNQQYSVKIYCQNMDEPLECRVEQRIAVSSDTITAPMTDEGGFNLWIQPESSTDK